MAEHDERSKHELPEAQNAAAEPRDPASSVLPVVHDAPEARSIPVAVTRKGRIAEIIIDDASWESASEGRQLEWRVALEDLVAEHQFDVPSETPLRMFVTVEPERITLDARMLDGRAFALLVLGREHMAEHYREYLDICRQMGTLGEADSSVRLEALDIAKRIVHDEAAETVRSLLAPLRPDHPTSRRLFTLLVTLSFDTTRLVRPHHLDAALYRRR